MTVNYTKSVRFRTTEALKKCLKRDAALRGVSQSWLLNFLLSEHFGLNAPEPQRRIKLSLDQEKLEFLRLQQKKNPANIDLHLKIKTLERKLNV